MRDFYLLDDDGKPYGVNIEAWSRGVNERMQDDGVDEWRVARDDFPGVSVSTVFLGIDHGYGESHTPILFETMIFGGEHDLYQERYATRDEAIAGHQRAVHLTKETIT